MNLRSRSLEALDWPFLAEALAALARTTAGRELALGTEHWPSRADLAAAFDEIDDVQRLQGRAAGGPPVGGVEDIHPLLQAAARGEVLDAAELQAAGATVAALAALHAFLAAESASAPALQRHVPPLHLDPGLDRTLGSAFDDEGLLSAQRYPVLGELRQRIASLDREIRSTMERLLDSPEYAGVLQDRYITVRGDRFVLPIKAEAKGMGLGIVHDASRTERTVFVEPAALVPLGNRRRVAEAELREEEHRILAALSALLGEHAPALRDALAAAARIDLAVARASFASRLRAVRPIVGDEGIVRLQKARHPVLALTLPEVVANDLCLDAAHPVLVLTGPNAGGKTVAMKTIGLAALLVRAGCFVPAAEGSRVDFFGDVLADIGDLQTVHEGLSSFSAHLVTLREMLATAGAGSLLLLDEVAAGTDPGQGGALARAVVERFADLGARVVATTHYAQLKTMAHDDPRVEVAALEYRGGRPTYRVVPGSIGESHALSAAARVGLDEQLLARARDLLAEGERALHDAAAALDAMKTEAAEQMDEAAARARSLDQREADVARREREMEGRTRELEKRAAATFLARLRKAEDEVRTALDALRSDRTREAARQAARVVHEARNAASGAGVAAAATASREARVGDRVRVPGIGLVGEVLSLKAGEAEVRAGSLSLRVPAAGLEVLSASAAGDRLPTKRVRPVAAEATIEDGQGAAATDGAEATPRTASNTVDLRGMRVGEALARLEEFLDESSLLGRDVAFVLHGHGTGAMKDAVRRFVSDSSYVSAWKPADVHQGGDGVTVCRLRG